MRLRMRGTMSRRRTPPGGIDRDVYVDKHATPEFIAEDVTGQYQGEELARFRARRPTDERIGRLEAKHDKLVETVGAVDKTVANMAGKLETFLETIAADRREQHQTERMRIGSRAKVIIAIVGAIGKAIGVVGTMLAGCV